VIQRNVKRNVRADQVLSLRLVCPGPGIGRTGMVRHSGRQIAGCLREEVMDFMFALRKMLTSLLPAGISMLLLALSVVKG
jgi:hypothetical protein